MQVRFDWRWEAQELYDAGYHFSDRRLRGTIEGKLTSAYYDFAEQSRAACIADDIPIDCKCHVDTLNLPYWLRLDAAFTAYVK